MYPLFAHFVRSYEEKTHSNCKGEQYHCEAACEEKGSVVHVGMGARRIRAYGGLTSCPAVGRRREVEQRDGSGPYAAAIG